MSLLSAFVCVRAWACTYVYVCEHVCACVCMRMWLCVKNSNINAGNSYTITNSTFYNTTTLTPRLARTTDITLHNKRQTEMYFLLMTSLSQPYLSSLRRFIIFIPLKYFFAFPLFFILLFIISYLKLTY